MSKRARRNHSAIFKARVAVDAIRGDKTLAELAKVHDVHPNQITDWKNQLLDRASSVFGAESSAAPAIDLKELHAKIGRLALENDFLAGAHPDGLRLGLPVRHRGLGQPSGAGSPDVDQHGHGFLVGADRKLVVGANRDLVLPSFDIGGEFALVVVLQLCLLIIKHRHRIHSDSRTVR